MTDRLLVILGDFSCVLSTRDKISTRPFRDESTVVLQEIINTIGLVDVGECLRGGREEQFTHFQGVSHARLDRVYVSCDLIEKYEGCEVKPVSFSDHCLVMRNLGYKKRTNSFAWELWKLNDKLLKDEMFLKKVSGMIRKIEGDKIGEQLSGANRG